MSYQYGTTKAAQQARELEAEARRKAAELAKLNAELDARIEARKKQLKYIPKVRTYAPTPEQIAYREQQHKPSLPEPQWAGSTTSTSHRSKQPSGTKPTDAGSSTQSYDRRVPRRA
jgi:hypothetical protein